MMTHEEREAYVQKLMSVLEGDEPEVVITESGTLETLPGAADIPPLNFPPRSTLTSADRRDRAELRALRAEVLDAQEQAAWPFPPPFGRPAVNPAALILLLSRPVEGIPTDVLHRVIPAHVWALVSRFQHIQYRVLARWIVRGYGIPAGPLIYVAKLWAAVILLGEEQLLPR
jgi:hypothetical protein